MVNCWANRIKCGTVHWRQWWMLLCSCLHQWTSPLLADQTSETKKKKHNFHSALVHLKLKRISARWGGADLVAGRLVWLLLKAQAEEGEGNRGEQGHRCEEGDGMHWTCEGREQSAFCSLMAINLGFGDSYKCCSRIEKWKWYLIWAWRRRAARTCRGREPRWPGWWPPCGCAGWVWWERMHSRCCIGRPCAWGSHRADLEGWKKTHEHLLHWSVLAVSKRKQRLKGVVCGI